MPRKPIKKPARTARRDPAPRAAGSARPVKAATGGPLILVAEDYEDARELYAEFLEYSGYRVIQAVNGHEAVEMATRQLPDLILMDLSMPGLDGWEATRILKRDERTRNIPIIALTGHALSGHSDGAKRAGCDAFIAKPCLPDALVAEVKKMLEQVRKGRRSRPATAPRGEIG